MVHQKLGLEGEPEVAWVSGSSAEEHKQNNEVTRMTKPELIEAVREFNQTASEEFLSQFDEDQLQEYIDHLLEADMSNLTAARVRFESINWSFAKVQY